VEFLLQVGAFLVISFSVVLIYFHQRLNAQDKYLTNYIRSLHDYKGSDFISPRLDTTEILEDNKKQEVYSPRHDPDTVMSGKVIDPFD